MLQFEIRELLLLIFIYDMELKLSPTLNVTTETANVNQYDDDIILQFYVIFSSKSQNKNVCTAHKIVTFQCHEKVTMKNVFKSFLP